MHYIDGAAKSLLKSQFRDGPLAGALPVSSTDRASASPYLAARCLPALMLLSQKIDTAVFTEAGRRLADFVTRQFQPEGGITCMAFASRPDRVAPLYTGTVAGSLSALDRTGMRNPSLWETQLSWLLTLQSDTGGFDTAVGFGTGLPQRTPPDWRDALPSCGWSTQVYALLAARSAAPAPCKATNASTVRRAVLVRNCRAEMTENADMITIQNRTEPLYVWRKRTVWPEICLL